MNDIKMVDLQAQYLRIKPEIDNAIQTVLDSTTFIQGPQVNSFAQNLSMYVGGAHVVTCANGTDALQIAMMALELKSGDEIIVPVHTYVATAEVISLLGLIPVFVDVDETTFNIDVGQLERKVTSRTKAMVPVHLYGQCADMEPIMAIAEKYKLHVIEDTAQALGVQYRFANGAIRKGGTIGTVGTTSFFPSKNLGCFGDGGAIFTNSDVLASKMRMIANHGQSVKYHHDLVGINSRLDTLQAAILDVKLNYLNEYQQRRNEVASFYDRTLSEIDSVLIPKRAEYSTHVFHQYTLRVNKRDELKAYLAGKGIPTMIYYPVPLHFQKPYKQAGNHEGSFPVTERLSKEVISLPIHTEMNEDQLNYICESIKDFHCGRK